MCVRVEGVIYHVVVLQSLQLTRYWSDTVCQNSPILDCLEVDVPGCVYKNMQLFEVSLCQVFLVVILVKLTN